MPSQIVQGGWHSETHWNGTFEWTFPGEAYILKWRLEYPSNDLIRLCGFPSDDLNQGEVRGMCGPISLFTDMFARRVQAWESEVLALWAECNPQSAGGLLGLSMDGWSVSERQVPKLGHPPSDTSRSDPQALSYSPDLHLEPVQGLAFPSNSSSALLVMAAGMILLARFRRSRLTLG